MARDTKLLLLLKFHYNYHVLGSLMCKCKAVMGCRHKKACITKGAKSKVDLLNEIGFDWTIPPPPTWDEMFDELKAYQFKIWLYPYQ